MISSTCFGQTFAHLQERKTEVFTTCGIMSCCCGRQSSSFLHTVHVVPRCRAPNPCLPQQQDTIPYVVKKTSVLRSWRWAKVCPKHVEWILEINKTAIVASRWFLYYLICSGSIFWAKNNTQNFVLCEVNVPLQLADITKWIRTHKINLIKPRKGSLIIYDEI